MDNIKKSHRPLLLQVVLSADSRDSMNASVHPNFQYRTPIGPTTCSLVPHTVLCDGIHILQSSSLEGALGYLQGNSQ